MDLQAKRAAVNEEIKKVAEYARQLEEEFKKAQNRLQQLLGKLEALDDLDKEAAEPAEAPAE